MYKLTFADGATRYQATADVSWLRPDLREGITIEEVPNQYVRAYLAGRCANGSELGKGVLIHFLDVADHVGLCGAKAGRRSAGWRNDDGYGTECEKCKKRAEKKGYVEVRHDIC